MTIHFYGKTTDQVLKVNKDAYKNMLSTPTPAVQVWLWKKMPPEEKIKAHLEDMKNDFRADSFDYYIAQD